MDLQPFFTVDFIPPENKEFNFTEIDGKVKLNFIVTLEHEKYSPSIILPRKSKIRVDIDDTEEYIMYAQGIGTYDCNSFEPEVYNLTVNYIRELDTDGSSRELYVGFYVKAIIGSFSWPPLMFWRGAMILPIIGDLFADPDSYFPITIHPV